MTAGEIIYQLWYRPLGSIRALCAEGGPWEQWKTTRGRSAMIQSITKLKPIELNQSDDPNNASLHFLSGHSYWFQTAFCLHSFLQHSPFRGKVFLHDDGTMMQNQLATLRRLFPGIEYISAVDNHDRILSKLPESKFPHLHERLSNFPLMKKILFIHTCHPGWNLFFDSDQLFFNEPTELNQWIQKPDRPIHAIDSDYAYGYTYSELLRIIRKNHIPEQLNTGIHGLHHKEIDWEGLESWCSKLMTQFGAHYFMEQAMIAMIIGDQDALALSATDYIVHPQLPEAEGCSAVLHHYVADSKKWYFRENWKRVFST
ncbi:MAG: glycosyl transferase [Verrucomicrobiota bacterium]